MHTIYSYHKEIVHYYFLNLITNKAALTSLPLTFEIEKLENLNNFYKVGPFDTCSLKIICVKDSKQDNL